MPVPPAAIQAAALRRLLAIAAALAATQTAVIVGRTEDGATVTALRAPVAGPGGDGTTGYRPMLHTSIVPGAAGPSAMRVPPGFIDPNLARVVGNGTRLEVGPTIA